MSKQFIYYCQSYLKSADVYFDNIIFVSFIPQIIMFVGFVLCVVTPFFTTHSISDAAFLQENKSTEITVENNQASSTVYFFDLQEFQLDAVLLDNSERVSVQFFFEL